MPYQDVKWLLMQLIALGQLAKKKQHDKKMSCSQKLIFMELWMVPLSILALTAYSLSKKQFEQSKQIEQEKMLQEAREREGISREISPVVPLDPFSLELGYGLIPLVDKEKGTELLDKIVKVRREIALELGVVVPKIRGVEMGKGDIRLGHYMVINPPQGENALEGELTHDPAFGLPALWIEEGERLKAEKLGLTVVDPPSIIITHLTELIKRNVWEVFTRQDVQSMLDVLKKDYPAIVEELIKVFSLGEIQKVLQGLLKEQVSIRNLVVILESIVDNATLSKDVPFLIEKVRQALGRQICLQYVDEDMVLFCLTLEPTLERRIIDSRLENGTQVIAALEPEVSKALVNATLNALYQAQQQGSYPVLLCSEAARALVYSVLNREVSDLVVLSVPEIPKDIQRTVPQTGVFRLFSRKDLVEIAGFVNLNHNQVAYDQEKEKKKILEMAKKELPASSSLEAVLKEVKSLRSELANQKTVESHPHPTLQKIRSLLEENDFSCVYIEEILDRVKKEYSLQALDNFEAVETQVLSWIGESISFIKEPISKQQRKIFILVGPTGVGKTTTIAKLAAIYGIGHSPNAEALKVCMITIDNYRIGARKQIQTYGDIMGIPVKDVESFEALKKEIDLAKDSDLILVDTIGKSPNDYIKLAEMRELLSACGKEAEFHLALSCTTKTFDAREIMRQFSPFNYRSVILTKLDETTCIGNLISLLYENNKPLSYITDGQVVPQNIEMGEPDADLGMANVNVLMGIVPRYNISHLLSAGRRLRDVVVETEYGVSLIAGASGISQLANADESARLQFLEEIHGLGDYDVIIVDTGAGASSNVVAFAEVADDVIVVTTQEPTAITDAYSMVKILSQDCKEPIENLHLVINRVYSASEGEKVANKLVAINTNQRSEVPFEGLKEEDIGEPVNTQKVDKDTNEAQEALQEAEKNQKSIYLSGYDLEELLREAAIQLSTPMRKLSYEVLHQGRKGFMNVGASKWNILVYKDESATQLILPSDTNQELGLESEGVVSDENGEFFIRTTNEVFLKVTAPKGNGNAVTLEDVKSALEKKGISVYKQADLEKVLQEATGSYVAIAPREKFDPSQNPIMSIERDAENMLAYLSLTQPGRYGADIMEGDILTMLRRQGICEKAILTRNISDFVDRPLYEEPVLVARGLAPVDGKEGSINYFYKNEKQFKLKETSTGQVNFKETSLIQNVRKGEVLAERIPPTEGIEGYDLEGHYLPAKRGQEAEFIVGNNVEVSEDGSQLLASCDGYIVFKERVLHVENVYVIDGDVGPKTGNVYNNGAVLVKGSVMDGFTVEVMGNLEILGSVGRAKITSGGNVVMHLGVNGNQDAFIKAEGSIWAKFIENSHVSAHANVYVSDGILYSQVSAGESVICQGKRAKIVGGRIIARESVTSVDLGAVGSGETIVEVGFNPEDIQIFSELTEWQETLREEIEELAKNIQTANKQFRRQETGPALKQTILPSLKKEYKIISQEQILVNKELNELQVKLDETKANGHINVAHIAHHGVVIKINGIMQELVHEVSRVTFLADEDKIKAIPYDSQEAGMGIDLVDKAMFQSQLSAVQQRNKTEEERDIKERKKGELIQKPAEETEVISVGEKEAVSGGHLSLHGSIQNSSSSASSRAKSHQQQEVSTKLDKQLEESMRRLNSLTERNLGLADIHIESLRDLLKEANLAMESLESLVKRAERQSEQLNALCLNEEKVYASPVNLVREGGRVAFSIDQSLKKQANLVLSQRPYQEKQQSFTGAEMTGLSEQSRLREKEIISLYNQGISQTMIAKKLKMNLGEVELIVSLRARNSGRLF
ncbi:UNVERIFIED_CONTAM: hypothetical protein PYX00_010856 [Menopon gallinae]|uniref:Flagellar biosynthesis protein FlhF n=1 Tax=Menopon gallinae TaxID=328185 RepID=A0AAW2H6R1_9NEOP